MLKYMHENGYTVDDPNEKPFKFDDDDEYAEERTKILNCFVSANTANNGQIECLKYLHSIGCTMNEYTMKYASGNTEDLKNPITKNVEISPNYLECVKFLHSIGCPWNKEATDHAAYNGNHQTLQYLHENGCPWDANVICERATFVHKSLKCLKYVHENGGKLTPKVCSNAVYSMNADNDAFKCLEYARQNGCPWDEDTMQNAIINKDLDTVKYLHEHGCPWNKENYYLAYSRHYKYIFRYMEENGCEIAKEDPNPPIKNHSFGPGGLFPTCCKPSSEFWGSDPVSDDEPPKKKNNITDK